MKRLQLALLLLSGTAGFLHASPCPIAPLSVYVALGSMGCTIGNPPTFTFKDFSFSSVAESPLTSDSILVTPTADPFSLNLSFSSSGFLVSSGQRAEYLIDYLVDPPPPEIIRFTNNLNDGPAFGPAFSQVTTNLCIDPGCQRTATVKVFDDPVGSGSLVADSRITQLTDSTGISPPSVFVMVTNDVVLDATPGGSAAINGFSNATGIAPEPFSVLLVGGGLLGLAMWRRRVKIG